METGVAYTLGIGRKEQDFNAQYSKVHNYLHCQIHTWLRTQYTIWYSTQHISHCYNYSTTFKCIKPSWSFMSDFLFCFLQLFFLLHTIGMTRHPEGRTCCAGHPVVVRRMGMCCRVCELA